MKTFVVTVFAALLCATAMAADPPPPQSAPPTLKLRASGLSVPQVAFVGFMEELESVRTHFTDDRLSTYVGDTNRIRTWIEQLLRNNQAILEFDTLGQTQNKRAWQFAISSQEITTGIPSADAGLTGIKCSPRLEITPIKSGELVLDVAYRPAAFYPDQSEALVDESQHILRSGLLMVPDGQSLVLVTNSDLDPAPLVVISPRDGDDTVTVQMDWPVPYSTTVPRSNAQALPFFAEIIPGEQVDRDSVTSIPPAAEPVSPPPEPVEVRATRILIPQSRWRELNDMIFTVESDDIDEGLSLFVGITETIHAWFDEQLRKDQAIFDFDTVGHTDSGRAWQFETGSLESQMRVPYHDERGTAGVRTIRGNKTGPRLQVTPVVDGTLQFEIAFRPPVFVPSDSELSTDAVEHEFHTGLVVMPGWDHSLVLATDVERDPLPLVVVTGRNPSVQLTHTPSQSAPTAAYLEDDVQFFPLGAESAVASSPEIGVAQTPIVEESGPGASPSTSDARFYPLVGPARLTGSGDLVRVDDSVVMLGDRQAQETVPSEPDVSTAADDIELVPSEPQTIEIHPNGVRRVMLSTRIKSVAGFNPDVVSVATLSPNSVQIGGGRNGATRLTIIDEDGEALQLTVIVSSDMTDLELLLERLYPEAEVEVVPIRDTVLLRGTVDDEEQVRQIEEIAEQFAPMVLNQLRVAGDATSAGIPAGYRVLTVNADVDVDVLEPGDYVDVIVWYWEQDDTGEPTRTNTETLLSGVEVYSVKRSEHAQVTALLLQPEEAEALSFVQEHFQSRCIRLEWRATYGGEDSRLNREHLSELRRHVAASEPVRSPPPVPVGSSYSGSIPGAASTVGMRVVAIGIGSDIANLGNAEPGDMVDLFASDPGLASPAKIVDGVRLVGIVEPKDEDERFVWLIVSPDDAQAIEEKQKRSDVEFAVQKRLQTAWPDYNDNHSLPYIEQGYPPLTHHLRDVAVNIGNDPASLGGAKIGDFVDVLVTSRTDVTATAETLIERAALCEIVEPMDDEERMVRLAVPAGAVEQIERMKVRPHVSFAVRVSSTQKSASRMTAVHAAAPPASGIPSDGRDADSDLDALREDIRALHEDVRRLIEVLEHKQRDEAADTSGDDPPVDEGTAMLFFNATWCGPCQRMRPIVNRLQQDGFAIRTIDVDEQRDLVREYHVTSIPAFVLLYDGIEVERLMGATTENALRSHLIRASSPRQRSETVERGRVWTELGIQIEEVSIDDPRMSDSHYRGAVQIMRVRDESPAAAAGLRVGDLLVGLHVWETISRKNVEYVLDQASSSSFSPLKFYVLRDGETLFGHFPHGERSNIEFPRQINHSVDNGILPIAATTSETVDLLPLPAGPAHPADDEPVPDLN